MQNNTPTDAFEFKAYQEELSELHKIIEKTQLELIASKQQNIILEDEFNTYLNDENYSSFKKYYNYSPLTLFVLNQHATILEFNKSAVDFFQHGEDALLGSSFKQLLSKRSFTDFYEHFTEFKNGSEKFLLLHDLQLQDSRQFSLHMAKIPTQAKSSKLKIACSLISYDTHSIVFMDYLAKIAVDQMHEGVVITEENGTILHVNNAFTDITGYARSEVLGKTPRILKSGRHDESFYQNIWETVSKHGWWANQIWNKRKNGNIYPQWLQINRILDPLTQKTYYIGTLLDISDRVSHEEELDLLAHYDSLTGLMNRHYITLSLEEEVSKAQISKTQIGVMFIDLDNFKHINDQYGHDQGDLVLQEASQRILSTVRHTDLVGRIGGDEFVIILPRIQNVDDMQTLSNKIIKKLSSVYAFNNHEYYISASIGISQYPKDGELFEDLMKNADYAMYMAKKSGKSQYTFFDEQYAKEAFSYENMKMLLHEAIKNPQENLAVYYQPIINPNTLELCEVEALVRMYDKEKKLIFPDLFIDIAEKEGMNVSLGYAIFESACQFLSDGVLLGKKMPLIAINLSVKQLMEKDLFKNFSEITDKYNCDISAFNFEISERDAMQNIDTILYTLTQLHENGSKILLDDFGTGYSSLSQLYHLPIDIIKIDKSFTDFICNTDGAFQNIIRAIISMAKELNMDLIIEGAETKEQVDWIKANNISKIQGYYYSKPIDGTSLIKRYLS